MNLYEYRGASTARGTGHLPRTPSCPELPEVAEAADKIGYPCVIKAQVTSVIVVRPAASDRP